MLTLEKLRKPLLYSAAAVLLAGLIATPFLKTQAHFGWLPSVVLLFVAALLSLYHKGEGRKVIVTLAIVGAVGWIIDAIGTRTGAIFGTYSFGGSLGPKILDTPVMLIVGWATIVYMTYISTSMLPLSNRRLTASAGLMVLFDILLEPVASRMGMWQFANNDVPFKNYVVWFLLGMLLLQILRRSRVNMSNSVAGPLLAMLLIFLLALNLIAIALKS